MKGLIGRTGRGLYDIVHDTSAGAIDATKFCIVECVKIFEKAIKSTASFDLKEVLNQGVIFVDCFFKCVKNVLGVFKAGAKSVNNLFGGVKSSVKSINSSLKLNSLDEGDTQNGSKFKLLNPFSGQRRKS